MVCARAGHDCRGWRFECRGDGGKDQELFEGIPAVKTTGYKEYPLGYKEKVAYQEMQDTLISRSTLELILPKVTTVQSTYGDRLKKIKESVLVSAVNARFKGTRFNGFVVRQLVSE